MSGLVEMIRCKKCGGSHQRGMCDLKSKAHKPDPNESVSPSRTRGSLPASPGQIESEAAAVQLAPVLCPQDLNHKSGGVGRCAKCGRAKHVYPLFKLLCEKGY